MKTINTKKIVMILLLIFTIFSSCLDDEDLNLPYKGYTPEFVDNSWEISSPEAENMNTEIIENLYLNFYDEKQYPTIRSLLIVRNGKLIAEAYCKDLADHRELHNIMSATKSITSILIGIALEKGIISSIDMAVYDLIPQYFDSDSKKREITLRQVLTMETGLDFNDNVNTSEMINYQGSSLDFVLQKELLFNPGEAWYYGDGNPQIISGVIQKLTETTEAEFAEEYLFNPLGIRNYYWESHNDGLTFGAIGLWLTPREMAKIGQLMLNKGIWNETRLVSEDWILESTKKQSEFQDYGYYWYPIEDVAFYAEGHGGQLIWVYPEKELVVVITSESYAKTYNLSSGYENLFNEIIRSIND